MISIIYQTRESIVAIIYIYGAKSIFLLIYDDQDTEND